MRGFLKALTIAACALAAGAAAADDAPFPSRTIRIVIPFTAGTGTDLVAREMTASMSQTLGVPVIVDNREGASGMIGTNYVAKSPADGYTVLLAATNMVLTSFVTDPRPYDPVKDFVPIGRIASVPMVMLTSTRGPLRTFGDVVQAAKAEPGKLNFGTSGRLGTSHVFTEQIMRQFNFTAKDVHYKNPGQAVIDTANGKPEFLLSNIPLAAPLIDKGEVRVIATGSPKRLATMPDVPTFGELAHKPEFTTMLWYGFFVPAGTPAAVRAKLGQAIAVAMQAPGPRKRIEMGGGEVDMQPADVFVKEVEADTQTFGRIIRELGIEKP